MPVTEGCSVETNAGSKQTQGLNKRSVETKKGGGEWHGGGEAGERVRH